MRLLLLICVFSSIKTCFAVNCYQCSSDEDPKGRDLCGAYAKFDKNLHTPVDCLKDDSVTPGTFCVKITKQSPRAHIWDGRWRTVIRRCASVTSTGVTNVCNWGVYPTGVYWEECYCTSDGCNGSSSISGSVIIMLLSIISIFAFKGINH